MAKQKKHPSGTIAQNKKALHDYFIEQRFEAGVALAGWEVKSLRAGKAQLVDSYVLLKDGEAWLLGSHITPLTTASTHVIADPVRTRKLLLHKRELGKLFGAVQQKGYACVALSMYWKKHLVKCEIALAKGKKDFDKRHTEKERDSDRRSSAPCATARTTERVPARASLVFLHAAPALRALHPARLFLDLRQDLLHIVDVLVGHLPGQLRLTADDRVV